MKKRMKKKGWSDKELDHLEKTLKKETKRDYIMKKNLHNFYYWTNVLVILLLNFAGIFILAPIIMFMSSLWIFVFTAVFALSIGAMLNYLSLSMSHLELKHHLIAIFIIPALVLADVFVFSDFVEFLEKTFNVTAQLSTMSLVVVFVGCLVLPYLFSMKERMSP